MVFPVERGWSVAFPVKRHLYERCSPDKESWSNWWGRVGDGLEQELWVVLSVRVLSDIFDQENMA